MPQSRPEPPSALDVIELKNGDRFEGRITAQVDGYVEVQLEAGAVVGISTAQVAAVRRGAGAVLANVAPGARPSNEWFVLHDGKGQPVGWLHASVSNAADGTLTVAEEYEFVDGRRRYQVTSLCTADAGWGPRSCYFRERISDPTLVTAPLAVVDAGAQPDRIVDERIVEATCLGQQLQVVRLDRSGRRERTIAFDPSTTFPLLARAKARAAGDAVEAATLFDPATEEMIVRDYDRARLRHVTIDGVVVQITEITENSASGRNSEWLDASMRTLRRELAGPALVALPSNQQSARVAGDLPAIPSAVVAEAGGEFGLWVPNPAWLVRQDLPAGQLALACEALGATIGLTRLDHLEKDTPLDTAADSVANWFHLLHADMRIDGREVVVVRDRSAIRLLGSGQTGQTKVRATVDVIPHRGRFLVLVCRAPAAAWDELRQDFEFLQRSIELEPQSLAPVLQGPIADRERPKGPANRRAPKPAPTSAPQPNPTSTPAPTNNVRVPSDG